MRLLNRLWIVVRDKILDEGVDQKSMIEKQILSWIDNPKLKEESSKNMQGKIMELKEQIDDLTIRNEQY